MSIRNALLAGAAGTAVLDVATYADMAVRSRPASELPKKMAARFAEMAGITDLDDNRLTAAGALIGYADGLGSGLVLAAARRMFPDVSWFGMGIALGAFTLIASEGTATALGQTNPAQWGIAGWVADIVPRCLFGWTACITYDALQAQNEPPSPPNLSAQRLEQLRSMEEVEFEAKRVAPWRP